MRKILIVLMIVFASACSNGDSTDRGKNEQADSSAMNVSTTSSSQKTTENPENIEVRSSASTPYPLVTWDSRLYRITTEEITEAEETIGEIMLMSLEATNLSPVNYSNYYEKGTKLWSIKQVDTSVAIAVEYAPGKFVKAVERSAE
ncbi:hypothetical protein [Paenibacillus harenae]|uniref:Uncharacterized protein n=1 Tax=Paenibacillus harenae TaxID=306543 RepID=A0ABT9U2L5_PAEHA|nr:hypothetical protein [Paenibacillus harenae]MDQ0062872.1 hypothetical protein [Paenibacillus harenae]MDQ0113867.1 hypothetical protein [Paenibacillus harenae]